ncbi:MAG: alpha/beta hydrolase [Rhodanobacteraceae bacterium]
MNRAMNQSAVLFVLALFTSDTVCARDVARPPDRSLDIYAAPAQRVDIGGRALNLRCSGSGSPTVLLDIGQGMTSMSWHKVQPLIARTNRVCSYDRAGYGFSDPGPLPRTAQAEADDLYALVHAAKLDTPLVLVGHSMAGYIVRLYASAHPADVAALVLVDPVSETLAQDAPDYAAREAATSAESTDYARHCAEAARKGELRANTRAAQACVPPPIPGLSRRLSNSIRQRYREVAMWETGVSERDSDVANIAAVKSMPPINPTIPVIVLSAGDDRAWVAPSDRSIAAAAYLKGHQRIAAASSRGLVVIVPGASHDIQEQRPDAIVTAVRRLSAPASSQRSAHH